MSTIITVERSEGKVSIDEEGFDAIVAENAIFKRGLGLVVQAGSIHRASKIAAATLAGLVVDDDPTGGTEEETAEAADVSGENPDDSGKSKADSGASTDGKNVKGGKSAKKAS